MTQAEKEKLRQFLTYREGTQLQPHLYTLLLLLLLLPLPLSAIDDS